MKRVTSYSSTSIVLGLLLTGLGGCSSEAPTPAAKKEEPKAPPAAAPVTGQSGLFSMYQTARQWSGDIMILKVEDIPMTEVKPEAGKYGAWRAIFYSPAKNRQRTYTFSVVDAEGGLIQGARAGAEEAYVKNPLVQPFPIQSIKADTPAALEEAKKQKDTAAFEAKHPDMPIQYILEWTKQTPVPAWRVLWGTSVGTSGYSVYIDATTGKYLKEAR
jgi:hypothetical protein